MTRALAAGIRSTWAADPDQLDLRRFLGAGREAVQAMAADYFELTGIAGRAATDADTRPPPEPRAWTAHDAEPE